MAGTERERRALLPGELERKGVRLDRQGLWRSGKDSVF